MAAARAAHGSSSDSSDEEAVCTTYTVVYRLKQAEWQVVGKGWSEIQLLVDTADRTFRLVAWMVQTGDVVLNANVTDACKYRVKTDDFHKFTAEDGAVYGFGFFQRDDSLREAAAFSEAVLLAIEKMRIVAGFSVNSGSSAAAVMAAARVGPPRPKKMASDTDVVRRGTVMDRAQQLGQQVVAAARLPRATTVPNKQPPPPQGPAPSRPPRGGPPPPPSHPKPAAAAPHAPMLGEQKQRMMSVVVRPPSLHTTDEQLDANYTNGLVPLGKLKILPPKKDAHAQALAKGVSKPHSVVHTQHVRYNSETRKYEGLPAAWEEVLAVQFGVPYRSLELTPEEHYSAKIPQILITLRDYLFTYGGLEAEGVFRVQPDQDECEWVKLQLNQGKFQQCQDINCVANLIKVFFRELPHRVLDDVSGDAITRCNSEQDAGAVVEAMEDPNKSLFNWLLDLCVQVAMYEHTNKMTAKNLAIVFGPNLFSETEEMTRDPLMMMQYSQKLCRFLQLCILYRKKNYW